ncbi:hypothetical protein [Streptomyces sp. NPDC088725]|uniref:hypothetical protein n=1 Tax=Streptomyces sp. NPDC088725 TaxID=3365873 RepID=UPI0037FE24FA
MNVIYDQLVREHGDVVSEAREAADQAKRQAESALDWSSLKSRFRSSQGPAGIEHDPLRSA